jgi:hypothetical protein
MSQISLVEWDMDGDGNYENSSDPADAHLEPGMIYLKTTLRGRVLGPYPVGCQMRFKPETGLPEIATTGNVVFHKHPWNYQGYGTYVGVGMGIKAATDTDLEVWCWISHPYSSNDDVEYAPPTVSIAWDLNGDGVYERTGDPSKVFTLPGHRGTTYLKTTMRWKTAGEYPIGCQRKLTDETVVTVNDKAVIYAAPPSGRPGVSINSGAEYTNSQTVELRLVWPFGATTAVISNDGGFPKSRTKEVKVGEFVEWKLDSSLTGMFTRNVYVRFETPFDRGGTTTYSDDIILDTTPPVVESASTKFATGSSPSTAGGKITVKAKDDLSGVAFVQVNKKPTAKGAKTSKYGGSVNGPGGGKVFVRVQDRAGNWSKWHQVKSKK